MTDFKASINRLAKAVRNEALEDARAICLDRCGFFLTEAEEAGSAVVRQIFMDRYRGAKAAADAIKALKEEKI